MLDELAGKLGPDEARSCARAATVQARQHYEALLAMATQARDEVRAAVDGHATRAALVRRINAFAWANRELWRAAQQLVRVERLPHDGANDGIAWEVPL